MTLVAALSSSMRQVTEAAHANGMERALGKWHSTEQFESEPRVQFADGEGVLSAITENGAPLPEPIVWDVLR